MNLLIETINLTLDLNHKKGGIGKVGEGDGPGVEVTEKFLILLHLFFHSKESSLVALDNVEIKNGSVDLLKLKSKLVGISEVELDIDIISRRLVSEHTDEGFKELNKFFWALLLELLVDIGNLLFVE